MAYGLYLSPGQTQWYRDDFSSDNKLTGTLYTDINQTTVKDLTGYTIKVRLSRPNRRGHRLDKTADIVVAANGTWAYAVEEAAMPQADLYLMTVQISKSGAQETTLNRVEFHILEGPSS